MRIRLQVLLPLLVGTVVGIGFVLAAIAVGDAVDASLSTVPGITRQRAVQTAMRSVLLPGALVTLVSVLASIVVARMVARPLGRIVRTTGTIAEGAGSPAPETAVAEVRDAARGISRVAGELRERHDSVARERSDLAALVEAVSEGILQVDAGGRVVRANHAARRLLGLPEKVAGYRVGSLFRHPELSQIMRRSVAGDRTDGAELVMDERRILVSATPQPQGGAVAILVDLTDLRRLEEVRRDFVANASHELKTPLTSIRGYSETLLADDPPEAERRQFLATIARNADRLQRIVDDLLDLSRLETGRWQPDLQAVHVLNVARSAWTGLTDRAGAADVRLVIDDADPDDDLVLADAPGLEQVFTNLLDNALRHTPPGGTIRVSVRPAADTSHESRSGRVVVEVADTGAGIPRDALPRIFERFYRVDPARSRAEGGTGLGLSIVRHLMESMSGGVGAESALGKGTTIRLWLPPAEPAPSPDS